MNKFDPSLVNPQLQPPTDQALMSFDSWDGSDFSVPPMLDQFPDYDWAAGFEFSHTNFPTIQGAPINPAMPGNPANMGYTFG